ncbi:MAG: T9SS type A sorting domain-containing protein [Bacteroidetes bacterium]|nr:T9SS type A sorting domain-containing protein [Bacteroidota bacterium]
MIKKLLLASIGLLVISASWAQYPMKSVKDLNFVPVDSLLLTPPKDGSLLLPKGAAYGDTVSVYCVVYEPSRQEDGRQTFFTGSRYRFVVMDSTSLVSKNYDFAFCTFVSVDSTSANPAGAGELVKGQILKVTGRVNEYRSLTQFELLNRADAIEVVGFANLADLPDAISVPIVDMNEGTWAANSSVNQRKLNSERHEAAKVRIKDLTVVSNSAAEFVVMDKSGNQMGIDDQANRIFGTTPPPPGSTIDSLDGYLFTRDNSGTWCINPVNYNAIYGIQADVPVISGYNKASTYFAPADSVKMVWNITTGNPNSKISSAKLFYKINDSETFTEVVMTGSAGIFNSAIAPVMLDSALVQFYAEAKIGTGSPVRFPGTGYDGVWVSSKVPSIKMVQFSKRSNGDTYLSGAALTLTGVVTASLNDVGKVAIQNGTGAWSAIRVEGAKIDTFKVGDLVSINGTVSENFNLTRIVYVTTSDFTIHSRGNAVPAPLMVTSAQIKTASAEAEAHESVLVELTNPYVVHINADAPTNSNFGEILLNEDSTKTGTFNGVRMDDLSRKLAWSNIVRPGKKLLYAGQKFSFVRGLLDYAFNDFKLIPRDSLDMGETKLPVSVGENPLVAGSFVLYPAYPNPFNPSTTIRLDLQKSAFVELVVFNLLGQQIQTLANGVLQPNTYLLPFNASGLSSGLYFYQLRIDNKIVKTSKMTLLK